MATVQRWTGIEVRALREAQRMSIREFAAHLGVSERMISKWEAGRESIRPRPVNQAALDTSLARCDPDTQARFSFLTGGSLVTEESSGAVTEPIG
ncbi:MAG: helix-turn-helix domain-containing protein, partial [Acidobacteria bacterium]|nr:helix-turn-helix domain-containing protein [Acidobacteriota bacterium]